MAAGGGAAGVQVLHDALVVPGSHLLHCSLNIGLRESERAKHDFIVLC